MFAVDPKKIMLDPGRMFGNDLATPDSTDFPFISDSKSLVSEDASCSLGAGIVLKRVIRKLFNHVHELQPSELDEEFVYRSSISYYDYLDMSKYLNDEKLSCSSLHKLDNLLTGFLSEAQVRRPLQANLFNDLLSSISRMPSSTQNMYIISVVTAVCLISWFLKNVARCGQLKSLLTAFVMVGFIQFFMHQHWLTLSMHQEKVEHCKNPSYLMKFLGLFNYGYDNCHTLTSNGPKISDTNIAVALGQFLSVLISRPLEPIGSFVGAASQNYLSSFSTLNQIALAPILLLIILLSSFLSVTYIITFFLKCMFSNRNHSHKDESSEDESLTSPKRKPIKHRNIKQISPKKHK